MKRSLPTGAGSSGNNSSTSNTNNTSTNNQAYYQSHPPSSHLPNMPAAPSSSLSFGTSPQRGGNNSSADLLALLLASQQQNNGTSFSASSSSPFPQGVNNNHMTANPASFSSLQQLLQRNNASANVNPNPDYQQQLQQMLQMQNKSALIAQLTQQLAAGGTDPNAVAAALLNNNLGGVNLTGSTGTNMAFQQQQQQQQQQAQGIPAMVQFPTSSNSGAATATAPPQDAQHQQAQLQALAAAAASAQQQLQVQVQQAPQVQPQAQPQVQPRPTTPSTSIRQMHSQLLRNVTSGNNNPIAAQRSTPATSTDSHSSGSANNRHNPGSRMVPLTNLNTAAPTTTAIGKMNPKKLFVLVRILLAYLEKSDPELHAEAEKIIKECKRKKKEGHIAYGSLSQAIGTRLWLAVGDEHWKMACQIHKRLETGHANPQKTKGYKKLNVASAASNKNQKNQKSKDDKGDGENSNSKKADDNGNKRVSFSEGV